MTNPCMISISDRKLTIRGRTLLTSVPSNITISPAPESNVNGAFVGAHTDNSDSRHVFTLGVLEGVRFMCCFRFKIWWMTQRMGTCGKDVPAETQFLLIESRINDTNAENHTVINGDTDDSDVMYIAMLPLLEGAFRATLQGNEKNELQLCLESGDSETKTDGAQCPLFVNSGSHPFDVISEAVRTVEAHMQSFRRRQEKKLPSILDYFGWCTWDAFYTDVTTEGIKEGLNGLAAGGTPAKFLIIDDGWQSVATDQQPHSSSVSSGSSFQSRLTHIKENYKFQKDGKDGQREEDPSLGLHLIVKEAKEQHNVKYVYVWHAVTGYWGGVKPGVPGMEHYESSVKYPIMSKGISEQEGDYALDIITSHGLGLVSPSKVFNFYNELHSYLAAAGIDGVKVDVQNILETLGAGFGGRVSLTRKFYQALEASIAQNFPDNGIIACMSHNTDSIYSAKQTAVVRASDDFYPRDPASHTIHIASVAYNSIFLGEFMQPDWDMFHSLHPAAEYHAAARAIGGCAVYVSDKPGHHDFELLRKLVLSDGTILRAQLPGRPSRDCLFCDPTRDGKSLLKIWNINKFTGVVGAFNCQGAGWCRVEKKNLIHDAEPKDVTGRIHSQDVDYLARVAPDDWNGDVVLYSHKQGELAYIKNGSSLSLALKPKEYEVFTVVPVKVLRTGVMFAPIGLIKMFNSGGAIKSLEYLDDYVKMEVHGCGLFGAFCSVKPRNIRLDSEALEYTYNADKCLITAMLPVPPKEGKLWNVNVEI